MRWFETTNDSLRKHEKLKKKCWQSRTLSIRKSFFVVQHRIEPHELTNSTINISSTLVHWCFRWGRGGCSGPARVHPILHQKPFMSNEVYPTLNCSWPIRAQIGGGIRRCNHTVWGGGEACASFAPEDTESHVAHFAMLIYVWELPNVERLNISWLQCVCVLFSHSTLWFECLARV